MRVKSKVAKLLSFFSEPETSVGGQPGFWGIGNGAGGFQMSFGIGAFPFGFFATNFNIGDGAGALGSGQVTSSLTRVVFPNQFSRETKGILWDLQCKFRRSGVSI